KFFRDSDLQYKTIAKNYLVEKNSPLARFIPGISCRVLFGDYNIIVKINNEKLQNDETKKYVLNQIKSISISFLLNIKKAKYYNNFLQIEEYVSL
ncbi:MAG: hypothetical protein HRT40_13765, partial [Campylobacteraceae bacterium]|nr:hypothetical protein [Campylobacteraceae bacterium]